MKFNLFLYFAIVLSKNKTVSLFAAACMELGLYLSLLLAKDCLGGSQIFFFNFFHVWHRLHRNAWLGNQALSVWTGCFNEAVVLSSNHDNDLIMAKKSFCRNMSPPPKKKVWHSGGQYLDIDDNQRSRVMIHLTPLASNQCFKKKKRLCWVWQFSFLLFCQ